MSIEYQAPTDLTAGYDGASASVALSWDASVDGVPLLFTASGSYAGDATSDHVALIVVGDGGGGASGGVISAVLTDGGGAGSAGGISESTVATSSLTLPVTVTVGQGGAGGAGVSGMPNSISGTNPGSAGTGSSFGSYLAAGGGLGGIVQSNVAGGTGTTQSGGIGALGANSGQGNPASVPAGAGGSATIAPGGGAGGGVAAQHFLGGQPGAAGGTGQTAAASPSAGGAAGSGSSGGNGANGVNYLSGLCGGGGGGGDGSASSNLGYAGGHGGLYGGGGGGGGATYYVSGPGSQIQGSGGSGAPGCVNTVTYWLHTHLPQYLIYRNGTLIGATSIGTTTFQDTGFSPGANVYYVVASYDGTTPMSPESNTATYDAANAVVNLSGRFVPASVFKATQLSNLAGLRPRIWRPNSNNNIRAK